MKADETRSAASGHLSTATPLGGGVSRCDECGEVMLEDERHSAASHRLGQSAREAEVLRRKVVEMNRTLDQIVLAMQAAWIEWKRGDGAEHAMVWIENTLDGGDCLPDGAPEGASAQEFFDQGREAGRGN